MRPYCSLFSCLLRDLPTVLLLRGFNGSVFLDDDDDDSDDDDDPACQGA